MENLHVKLVDFVPGTWRYFKNIFRNIEASLNTRENKIFDESGRKLTVELSV